MAITALDVKNKLKQFKSENGFYEEIEVARDERENFELLLESGQSLPEGVNLRRAINANDTDFFFRLAETNISDIEIIEFLMVNQAKTLKKIKTRVTIILAVIFVAITLFIISML